LLASAIFFYAYFGCPQANHFAFWTTRRNVFFALLGCLLLVMFLEEISWGQRLLGLRTPAWLAKHHRVDELNLHNLAMFQPDRSMNYLQVGWLAATLGYLGLLPFLVAVIPPLRSVVRRLALPIPSRVISCAWWVAVLVSILMPVGNSPLEEHVRSQEAPEVVELTCEFLLLALALETVLLFPGATALPARHGWAFLAISIASVFFVVGFQMRNMGRRDIESAGRVAQAQHLAGAGRMDEARKSLVAAIELAPCNLAALVRLGAIELNAGATRHAAERFHAALQIEPDNAECRFLLGGTLLMQRDFEAAAEQLAKAVELVPREPDYQQQLGMALLHLTRMDDALRHTAAAVRLAPHRADTRYHHALVLLQCRELSRAAAELETALRIAPDLGVARDQLTRVRELLKAADSRPASSSVEAAP
jgi:tetratricopeptide (TPR) repeat protein